MIINYMKKEKFLSAVSLLFAFYFLGFDVYSKETLLKGINLCSANELAAEEFPFPKDMQCLPQLVYRYRKDGKPGREIVINFIGGKLFGKAKVEVAVEGLTECTNLSPKVGGDSICTVILPANIGLDKESKVILTLVQREHTILKTVIVPPMRYWNVYLYNHSHVDVGYTNTQKNVETLHKTNILEGIKLAEATKDFPIGSRFRWNPEVTWPIERLWVSMPEQRGHILKAVRDGYLCIDASYLNINTSVCSDEELFHIFQFSRLMQKLTGKPADVFQQMDIPGITSGLIPVMAQEGIKYVMSWPNCARSGNAHKGTDGYPFWWAGADGKSKVLFFQPGMYASSGSMEKGGTTGRPWFGQRDPSKVPAVIKTGNANVNFTTKLSEMEKAKYPFDFFVFSWSLWDNSPLDADVPGAVKKWNEQYAYPHITIAGGHEIMEMIDKKYGDKLPVVKGDYTEYWTDGLGTAAGLTAMNRNTKEKLTQAETLWSMLHPGQASPRNEFDEAWRYISLGSEHTWCFENPTESYFQDAIWKVKQDYFHQASDRTLALFDEALAPATDKSKGAMGPPDGPSEGGIAVLNTNSWNHGGLITLSKAESTRGDRVTDEQGKEVPSQRLTTGELVFLTSDIPALGSRHYRVEKGNSSFTNGCKIKSTTLENSQLQVTVDPLTGNISHLINRTSGRDYADLKVNGGLNAFRWLKASVDAPRADSNIVVSTVEAGPLVAELRVTSKGRGCRGITRSVRIVEGEPWVEISNVVDKLPLLEKDGIHFGFGFDIPHSVTRVDIPWGVMELEKDQWPQGNRNWIVLQRWLDISNDKAGVTWCSLDAPLFEQGNMTANIDMKFDKESSWLTKLEPSSTIYSWVMNNHWETNFPLTQDGPVTFRYRILPHGAFNVVTANRFGMEQSQPLTHVAANKNPKITPLILLDNDQVYITILKPLGNCKETLFRLRSISNKPETVKLTFPAGTPESIRICPVGEEPGDQVNGPITMLPYGISTFRLKFKSVF